MHDIFANVRVVDNDGLNKTVRYVMLNLGKFRLYKSHFSGDMFLEPVEEKKIFPLYRLPKEYGHVENIYQLKILCDLENPCD